MICANPHSYIEQPCAITVSSISEAEFLSMEEDWQFLLKHSDADPLFMSWHWLSNWWQCYRPDQAELFILVCRHQERIVGIAPFYIEPGSYFKGMLPIRRLQFIGTRFSGGFGIRCEYCSAIVDRNLEDEVIDALADELVANKGWHEAAVADLTISHSVNQKLLMRLKEETGYCRIDKSGPTYRLSTTGCFQDYLKLLGKNTRLKLFNRRKVLESMGSISCRALTFEALADALRLINEYHRQRWGRDAFCSKRSRFLQQLVKSSHDSMLRHSSILMLDNKPLSVIINLTNNKCIYNIQLGFREGFDKRVSLGTLHLGYAIEQAFEDPQISAFDLLEGQGKQSNYKSHLAEEHAILKSSRWFRNPLLALIFSSYDRYLRSS